MDPTRVFSFLLCSALLSCATAGDEVEVEVPVVEKSVDWRGLVKAATWEPVALEKRPRGTYHITGIAAGASGDRAVTTFGRGLFVSRDGGAKWRKFQQPSKRPKRKKGEDRQVPDRFLKTDYLSGAEFVGGALWVRSVGHGFGVQDLGKRTWRWWSGRQLDNEYLFPTSFDLSEGQLTISTTDGLWATRDRGRSFTKTGPSEGLDSEYVLAQATFAQGPFAGQWLALLGGLVHVSPNGSARTVTTRDGIPDDKVRGIHRVGERLLVRTDRGLGISADGRRWATVDQRDGMASAHVYALVEKDPQTVFLGTAKGLVEVDLAAAAVSANHLNGADPRRNQINALALVDGELWAGSTGGLWRVRPGREEAALPPPPCQAAGVQARASGHPVWPRPIDEAHNPLIDQTYQFGQTWGGQFGVHKGVEFNNAEGTQVLAVAEGEVVYAQNTARGTGVVTIRHDEMYEGHYVYSLYIHLSGFIAKVGQRVGPGTPVGRVGHTGPATNDHLHLEVRLSKVKGDAMKDFIVVNPALFVSRRPGRGALTGRVRKGGKRLDGARIYGPIVPEPQDTPFGFFEVYGRGASGDPGLREDFMIMDIPPGVYPVEVVHRRETRSACVEIKAGVNTWIEVEF